ncbi:MAG: GNAT family N-acetyltransferase [Coleofasciculus sp. S288]|nr:GNAT family N-acetyltransferase [Coleofasciculus sp. S288]
MPLHQRHAHKLDASQVDEIVQLLALAFENGSGISQICNAEGEELHRRLHILFRAGIAVQAAANQLVLSAMQDERVTGVAVVQEPESRFPLWAQIVWLLQVSIGVSPVVAWRLWQSLRILERHHPLEPHYYLMLLGVHPNFQRKGYARALLEVLHARSEAHPTSRGVFLETANPKNVAFYNYFGYQIKTQVNINGIENFIMFRPNFVNRRG